jgi:flagellar hook-associated protein 3 FlgL
MRVTPTMQDRTFLENITQAKVRMDKSQEEISTGRRVNQLSDDPFAAAQSGEITAQMSYNDQYLDTIDQLRGRLDITDTVVQSMITSLDNAKVLAVQSLSGTTTAEARASLALGVDGVLKQVLSDANAQFNGSYLFSGTQTNTVPFTETPPGSGTIVYSGNDEAIYARLDNSTVMQTNITGEDLAETAPPLFSTLTDLKNAIQNNDTATIEARLNDLNTISDRLNSLGAVVGNSTQLAEQVRSRLTDQNLAMTKENSRLSDANMVESISNFSLAEQGVNATLSAKARIQQLSLIDYLR